MMERVYLDWNATAPLCHAAREEMLAALSHVGNPSSVHAEGRKARALIERARGHVAELVGSEPRGVIFTGGASEAAQHALSPTWSVEGQAHPMGRLYVSAIEHPCVLAGGRFAATQVQKLPVTADGRLDLAALQAALDDHDPAGGSPLVAVMAANNETGIVQPVAEAAAMTHARGGFLVCDAVQAVGRIPVDITRLGADALLLSSHKIGGPQGAGALVLASEAVLPTPLLTGGGQERRQRAGTENVAGIAGFGGAAAVAGRLLSDASNVAALRDRLRRMLLELTPSLHVIGAGVERLPNTLNVALPGASAEVLVAALDLLGIAVSAGSACSSGKTGRSHVLAAMGMAPEIAGGAIRISIGPKTTINEIEALVDAWRKMPMTSPQQRPPSPAHMCGKFQDDRLSHARSA